MDVRLPWKPLAATAISPLAVIVLGVDGSLSRLDGGLLVGWFIAVMFVVARTGREIVAPALGNAQETSSHPLLQPSRRL
jgi:hypothetical protein